MTTKGFVSDSCIPEVVVLGKSIHAYYDPVYIMGGKIQEHDGIAVSVTNATFPSETGANISVGVNINIRSLTYMDVYRLFGFCQKYPGAIGALTVDFGTPDAQLGAGECNINMSLICDPLYPSTPSGDAKFDPLHRRGSQTDSLVFKITAEGLELAQLEVPSDDPN